MNLSKEKFKHILKNPFRIFTWFITRLPYFNFIKGTEGTMNPIIFKICYKQKVLGYNK